MSYNLPFPRMTTHARQQLAARFTDVVPFDVVCRVVNAYAREHGFEIGQTYVEIIRFEHPRTLPDCTVGSIVYAVVDKRFDSDAGRICTILIRPASATDRTFRKHSDIPQNHSVSGRY